MINIHFNVLTILQSVIFYFCLNEEYIKKKSFTILSKNERYKDKRPWEITTGRCVGFPTGMAILSTPQWLEFSRNQRPHGKIEVGIYRPKAQRLNHQHGYSVEFVTKYDIDAFPQNLILLISF